MGRGGADGWVGMYTKKKPNNTERERERGRDKKLTRLSLNSNQKSHNDKKDDEINLPFYQKGRAC